MLTVVLGLEVEDDEVSARRGGKKKVSREIGGTRVDSTTSRRSRKGGVEK